jgi:hypothetical protein
MSISGKDFKIRKIQTTQCDRRDGKKQEISLHCSGRYDTYSLAPLASNAAAGQKTLTSSSTVTPSSYAAG